MKSGQIVLSATLLFFLACGQKADEQQQQSEVEQTTPNVAAEAHMAEETGAVPLEDTAVTRALSSEPSSTMEEVHIVRDPSGKYAIQLSAWRTRSKAEAEARKLQALGIDVYIQKAQIPEKGGVWYRLRVGNFYSKDDALAFVRTRLSSVLEEPVWIDWARK